MLANWIRFRMLVRSEQALGFSLVELMVTIAIIAISTSFVIPSFKDFIANSQIRTTSESIRNGLQLARAEAVKRNVVVTFILGADSSWTVCAQPVAACPASEIIQSKAAKEGSSSKIKVTITGTNTLGFTSLGNVTSAAGQMSRVDIDNNLLTAAQSKDLRITIGAGGNVRVCDPNISSTTDVRYCS